MEGVISECFAQVLAAERERFNALVAEARGRSPQLDGDEFLELLRRRVDPVIRRVGEADPRWAPAAADALFRIGLELLVRRLAGRSARFPDFETLWAELLAGLAAVRPEWVGELAGPWTNALYQLRGMAGCRPRGWTDAVTRVAGRCRVLAELRAAGQVAAWMAGMAHYRDSALELLGRLPAQVAAPLLGVSDAAWDGKVLDRLRACRWYAPDRPLGNADPLSIVREAGDFRGFGGEFLRPPAVRATDDGFLVSDGVSEWLLLADAFGVTLHRIADQPVQLAQPGRFRISSAGLVQGPSLKAKLPLLAHSSSQASTADTLAVTLPHSHRVFLVAEMLS